MGVARNHAFCGLMPAAVFLCGLCFAQTERTITYHLEAAKPLSRFSSDQLALLVKLNHADSAHLARLPRIVVPDRWNLDELLYSPMPHVARQLSQEKKAIMVDLTEELLDD